MEYPYTDQFYTIEQIKEMYNNIKNYDYKERLLYDRYYTVKNIPFNKYKYLYIGRPLLLLSRKDDFNKYNIIVDYFQNKERVKCKIYGKDYSPYDLFIKQPNKIKKEALEEFGKITPFTIKEAIYKLKYECTSFRQLNLVSFIQMFQPKSVLDFSAGWGERLLSCIAMDIEYTGIDPNTNLFKGYNEIIDMFAKDKTKYTIINNTIQDTTLEKTYDMIFTSPPYFDLEIYSSNKKQSVSQYSTEEQWTNQFLKVALQKSYNHLNMGGYMCININQKKKEKYIEEMLNFVYTLPNMHYYGVIGYSDESLSNPQPIWIWRKHINVPNELYNPDIIVTKIEKFYVVRDDYLIGGTKQRGLVPLLENTNKEIFIYGGPVYGYAQIALAYSAYLTHKKAVVFVEKRNKLFPLTEYAKSFGAYIHEVPQPAYLNKILMYSEEFYKKGNDRFLLKIGADNVNFINYTIENIKKSWKDKQPERMWLVAGSAILLNILYSVFPKTYFNVIQVGRTVWDDLMNKKRTTLYVSDEKFENIAKEQPPYPTVSTYDAKLWAFVKKYGKEGDYIWNVGKSL